MGLNLGHVLGRHSANFFNSEATPGTFAKAAGADFAQIIDSDIAVSLENLPRRDTSAGRSPYEFIEGKRAITVTINSYMIPSGLIGGSLGTPPDLGPLILASMGDETADLGTDHTYALSDKQDLDSISYSRIMNRTEQLLGEYVTGWIIEEWKTSWSGGDSPLWAFTGPAMNWGACATSTVDGAASGDNFDVQSGKGAGFRVPAVIQVLDTPTEEDVELTTVSGDTLTATGESFSLAGSEVVKPFFPTPASAGSPIARKSGSLVVDAVSWPIVSGDLAVKQNFKIVDDEAFAAGMTDAIIGWRDIAGTLNVRGRADRVEEMAKRWLLGDRALTMVFGAVAGSIFTYTMPQVKLHVDKMTVGAEEGTMAIPYEAADSTEGAMDALAVAVT